MSLFNFDLEEKKLSNCNFIIGTDEAGRGPAAGGVWAAAVCFSENIDEKLFENPTEEYRGKPFWAWNCDLDKDRLKRQIE